MNHIFHHGEKQTASNSLFAKPDFHLLKSTSRKNYKTARDPFFADANTLKWSEFQARRLAPIAAGKVHGLLHDSEMLGTSGYFATHRSMGFSVSMCDFTCNGQGNIKQMLLVDSLLWGILHNGSTQIKSIFLPGCPSSSNNSFSWQARKQHNILGYSFSPAIIVRPSSLLITAIRK